MTWSAVLDPSFTTMRCTRLTVLDARARCNNALTVRNPCALLGIITRSSQEAITYVSTSTVCCTINSPSRWQIRMLTVIPTLATVYMRRLSLQISDPFLERLRTCKNLWLQTFCLMEMMLARWHRLLPEWADSRVQIQSCSPSALSVTFRLVPKEMEVCVFLLSACRLLV